MGVVFGLLAAILYGSGDYLGGRVATDVDVRRVLVVSQATAGVVCLVALVFVRGLADGRDLLLGVGAGIGAAVGLGLLYRALSVGRAGVVAPITAVVGAVVPIGWGLATGKHASAVALAGVAIAVGASALVAREDDDPPTETSGAAMAVGAGLALGAGFVCYAATSSGSGLWPAMSARVASLSVAGLALAAAHRRDNPIERLGARRVRLAAVVGAADMLGTIALLAGVRTSLGVLVAAVTALAPGFTVFWAWALLRERLSPVRIAGVGLALVGLVLIAAG
jgi:drug/metabolite transporter (DMT)-like permease